jgi:hypothetical protein
LESIENELQQLVEKMRLGATSQQNSNASLTPPPGFTTTNNTGIKNKGFLTRKKKTNNLFRSTTFNIK